jgi:hypothetical protein
LHRVQVLGITGTGSNGATSFTAPATVTAGRPLQIIVQVLDGNSGDTGTVVNGRA